MDSTNTNGGSDSQNIAARGAAVLLVIGEPFSEEHKKLIQAEVTKGFKCWDTDAIGVDINDELAHIANKADLGEEGPNGERVIRHNSENIAVEILVNPQTQTVTVAMKNFLTLSTKHKHLIYAGHAYQGSGAWILQDDTYTFNNFAHTFKDPDVGNAIRQQKGGSLFIYTQAEGDWSNGHITKTEISKLFDVKLNPSDKLDTMHGVLQFTAYISNFIKAKQLNELLQSTDVVGNIRFSRPTLYIFPGCQGDSALFGISGFNLLVNGGYSRKACFWDLIRHLDRIDAALMTHLGADNLFGFSSVLQRKSIENVHPEIGFMYVNGSDKVKPITENGEKKDESLMVNLAEEGNKLLQYAKQIGQFPHPCTRSQSGQTIEPINLYHKVGIGSLDMYILNPITDSKEMKEFYQQWNQRVAQFGTNQQVPLPNTLSVCALLVWRPSDPNDNITRIFFPGNAPQHKVIEGLEKLKSLDILKRPTCTKTSLTAKPATKKPASLASKPPAKAKISPASTPRNEVAKKEDKTDLSAPRKAATPKAKSAMAPKAKKEDVNKKTSKSAPKDEKTDKSKSSTSSSPSKSSVKSMTPTTPKQLISPVKQAEPVVVPEPVAEVKSEPKSPSPEIPEAQQESVVNGGIESSVDPPGFTGDLLEPTPVTAQEVEPLCEEPPAPVPDPEPVQNEPECEQAGPIDKNKMLELGIYDEDHDIEEDLNAQSNLKDEEQDRVPAMFDGMGESMHEDLIGDMHSMNAMQGSIHGDLMSGSMHASMIDYGSGMMGNGGTSVDDLMTPEDETSEEIQPQALPEPMAYAPASYSQEPDVIPSMNLKEEPADFAEPESLTPSANEPDLLQVKQETLEDVSASQDLDEDSTMPVEAVQPPADVPTPDEVENNLPEDEGFSQPIPDQFTEDIQEKDVIEDNEKESVAPIEPAIESVIKTEEGSSFEPDMEPQLQGGKEEMKEMDVAKEEVNEQSQEMPVEPIVEASKEEVKEFSPEMSPELEMEPALDVAKEEARDRSPEMSPEPELDVAKEEVKEQIPDMSQEPEIEPMMETAKDDMKDENASLSPEPAIEQDTEKEPDMEKEQERSESPDLSKEVDLPLAPEIPDVKNYFPDYSSPDSQPMAEDFGFSSEYSRKSDLLETPDQELDRDPSPEMSLEPEMQQPLERSESPEELERDVIERPKTPEPAELEQEQTDSKIPEEFVDHINEQAGVPVVDKEDNMDNENTHAEPDMIENDYMADEDLVEPVPVQQTQQSPIDDDKPAEVHHRPETPESDRAESPESQVDARDSLEKELKEVSHQPMAGAEEQRDSIERELEDSSKESSPVDDKRDSIEKEMEVGKETPGDDQRDSIEKEIELGKETPGDNQEVQRDSIERETEHAGKEESPISDQDEQRESVERSFEDDSEETEETDDDEDDESSSFEQEEATDEKCLIPGSIGDDHTDGQIVEKGMEADNQATPYDSLVDQPSSDNLLTPESEMTDQSHGGQLGYHQMGDQEDKDSMEGIDDRDSFGAPPPQQACPFGQDFEQFGAPIQPSGPMSTNPFDMLDQPEGQSKLNPFIGLDEQNVPQQQDSYDESSPEPEDDFGQKGGPAEFNPLAEWGEPMGLPSPPPPEEKASAKSSPRPKSASKLGDVKKTGIDSKKPSSATKKPASATKAAPAKPSNGVADKKNLTAKSTPKSSNGVPEKTKSRAASGNSTLNSSRSSPASNTNTTRLSMGGKTAPKPRPASAPTKEKSAADTKSKASSTKRPATATGNRASPAAAKMPPLPAFTPFYMDLTYIPNHGNLQYSDVEFFKRIRARYYVLSTLTPNTQILDSLLEAKNTWEDKELSVTVIPTYDNEHLRLWMSLHKEKLADQKVEIAPSASRCTIQLQDHETSSSAYRLEF